jgi:hypothetical protein
MRAARKEEERKHEHHEDPRYNRGECERDADQNALEEDH